MVKRLTKIFLSLICSVIILAPAGTTIAASSFFNNSKDQACQGIGATNGTGNCSSDAGNSLNNIIKNVINILSIVVGIVAIIMIIIAGFKFITSGGGAENVANARSTILYAAVGLVVVAIAQIIVHFVLTKATK